MSLRNALKRSGVSYVDENEADAVLGRALKSDVLFESLVDVVDVDIVDEKDNEVGLFIGMGNIEALGSTVPPSSPDA